MASVRVGVLLRKIGRQKVPLEPDYCGFEIPDAFVVNGGQLLLRWTNDQFLATPHRAINRSGGERYALAFFCDAQIDWPVAAVPTTVGPDKPPKYPTTYYTDYMTWYQKRNYDVLNQAQAAD